jgi:hypothetical protein
MFPGSRCCICWVCFGYSPSLCHGCQTLICDMEAGRNLSINNVWIVLCHLNNIVFLYHTFITLNVQEMTIQIGATFMQLLMNSTKEISVWDCLLWKSRQYSSTAASVLLLQILCTKCICMCSSFKNVNGAFTDILVTI